MCIRDSLKHVGVGPKLSQSEFEELRQFGVFRQNCRYENGRIRSGDGAWIAADLDDKKAVFAIAQQCLGRELRAGCVLHAGFLLGPRGFYSSLRDMPEADRRQFDMRGVGHINQLYGAEPELRVLQRRRARFINTTMMATALGAAISDGLDDGRVVSGVGGQYNFVAMAHALPDARSVLCLRATRRKDGRLSSNIIWNYGHTTIPRHLRDIVITEYGIADLRGRTDAECVAAMLQITDSRFQAMLLGQAIAAGKIGADHRIPEIHRHNTPERLERALSSHRRAGLFSEYPFGTDLTDEEIVLSRALRHLKDSTATPFGRLTTTLAALLQRPAPAHLAPLRRLGLSNPQTRAERLWRRLVARSLQQTG